MDTARSRAVATEQINNDSVVVTKWSFSQGAECGWHCHAHDYVVVPQTSGLVSLVARGRSKISRLIAGVSYFRKVGVEHNVINCSAYEIVFFEVEIK